jgi:hypothetical protein
LEAAIPRYQPVVSAENFEKDGLNRRLCDVVADWQLSKGVGMSSHNHKSHSPTYSERDRADRNQNERPDRDWHTCRRQLP